MRRVGLAAVSLAGVLFLATLVAEGGQQEGQAAFARRCSGCHELDRNKVGPQLRKIFGRKAASVDGFPYSEGLKTSTVTWDAPTLDRWLADPASVVPDNDMPFRLDNRAERAAIVAFLKDAAKQ